MTFANFLLIVAAILVVIIIALIFSYLSIMAKESKRKSEQAKKEGTETTKIKIAKEYTINSIFDFMEFEK